MSLDMMREAFEMGRQSNENRVHLLESRERAVEQREAELRAWAIVLGVAQYAVERDIAQPGTVCSFRIDDTVLREAHDLESAIVEAGKETVRRVH